MYDFYEKVNKRYNNMYSTIGPVERSFWKNVGNIVNKKAIFEQNKTAYNEIMGNTEKIMRGIYDSKKRN